MKNIQAAQVVEQQENQKGLAVVVDILRTVNKRYGLVAEIRGLRKAVNEARKPFNERSAPHREELKKQAASWGKLTADSPAADFKKVGLAMGAERQAITTINEEFAKTVESQTDTIGEKQKAVRTYDTLIPQMLNDAFVKSLLE